jgi:septum formation protein
MNDTTRPKLILASSSPRRRELLRSNGYHFRPVEPPHDEPITGSSRVDPCQFAEANAYFKARSVADAGTEGLVLGADTVVAYRGRLFGKPTDEHDARYILSELAGTTHRVITGVALIDTHSSRRLIRHDSTAVTMRPMPPDVLEAYLASGAWQSKAGAYGIQDQDDAFIERIEGSFSNVMGLPLELLSRMLAEMGYALVQ